MHTSRFWIYLGTPVLFGSSLLPASSAPIKDSNSLKSLFANPPREYSTAPLWVWNDMLTEETVRQTLRDLADQEVRQAFVHPRPGLMTPYLSDDWFRLWSAALEEASRLDMNLWIYDENSYPSGFAGGWVPELLPEACGQGLLFEEVEQPGPIEDGVLGVYEMRDGGFEIITDRIREGVKPPPGRYVVCRVERAAKRDWTAGRCYVDLLHPGVTEKFIELTMEAYRSRFGDQFGRRIPGWFTDEPHLSPGGLPHWSDHLADAFRERWGYDLVSQLPGLQWPVGDWRRLRHNYFQLLLEEFIERWAKPTYEYAEKHNLEFTGHYWEHGWPRAGHGSDNMAMYAWQQRPGIDTLMNQYGEEVDGQFGNTRSVKELSSAANQLGRNRTLCEAFGAGGWDLRFEDIKRIGDWLYVLGVNMIDEHLSYVTIRGTRKRDHPQSFSYHEPWWPEYHVMARYFTRLSTAMSHGRQVNEILVIEPTTTTWMYQPDSSARFRLREIGQSFQDLVNELERKQVEYDLASEDILARHGSVATVSSRSDRKADGGTGFVVGRRRYHTVVLPDHTENLNQSTADLLERYLTAGGRVLSLGPAPEYVEGVESERMRDASRNPGWEIVDPARLPELLHSYSTDRFSIQRGPDDRGLLFHHRRRLEDGELLLFVNSSLESPSSGSVRSSAGGVEEWSPWTGRTATFPFRPEPGGVSFDFNLPPAGSLLLFLAERKLPSSSRGSESEQVLEPSGDCRVRRLDPNVLSLDFVDVRVGGETRRNVYCYEAAQFAFRQHGWEKNPWDHAVQFRDEIIRREFPTDSGLEVRYRFRIEEQVPRGLDLVIERPDLYHITCNGQKVLPKPGEWWLDRSFGRISLASAAQTGENTVILTASPMTVFHEIEPAYLVGEFSLRQADAGFAVVPEKLLTLGPWKEQGLPLYGHAVSYSQDYHLASIEGQYVVRLSSWLGSVAQLIVNGKPAGHFVSRPWEVEVTEKLRAGQNTVEIRVIGTLKNTLGPHHGSPELGKAWPGDFRQAPAEGPPPGGEYHTVGYGLFASPQLVQYRVAGNR